MKTFYENPEMEVIAFECEDIITTSGLGDLVQDEDNFGGDAGGGALH